MEHHIKLASGFTIASFEHELDCEMCVDVLREAYPDETFDVVNESD